MSLFLSASLALIPTTGAEDPPVPPPPVQDAPPVYPEWSGALTIGLNWTQGNTESTNFNGNFNAQRRDEQDRWTFDAFANQGETDPGSVETQDNYGAGAKYDYFTSDKLYFFGNGSGKIDHLADLDLRTILGGGAGYQWKESDKLKWGTEAGLSYVDEDFEGGAFDEEFLAVRLASNLIYQISETSSFEQVSEVLPSLNDSEDVIAKLDNRLKLRIVGKWIAQIQYVLDFDGSVPTGPLGPGISDGKEETDHRLVVGIGWNFGP